MSSMTNHPSFSTPFGGRGDLNSLLALRDELGIKDTTIEKDGSGFRISWGSDLQEVEDFTTFEDAVNALRMAAQ